MTLFSLGVELFKNITDAVEEYLKSNGFKKIIQKDPSYQDIIKEVTSPKQLPLFFYSFSGGFHFYLYSIGEKSSKVKDIIDYILKKYIREMVDVVQESEKISKAVIIPQAPFKFFTCSFCRYSTTADYPLKYLPDNYPGEKGKPVEKVFTPSKKTIKDLCDFLGIPPEKTIKTLIYKAYTEKEKNYFAVLVPGSRNIDERKLKSVLKGKEVELAGIEEVERLTGAPHGFAGPVDLKGLKIIADIEVAKMRNVVTGANERDYHLINVNPGRDFYIDILADVKETQEGDSCPLCGNKLNIREGIKIAEWEKFCYKNMEAETGTIYFDNVILALSEQNCDEKGLKWPSTIAPYKIVVIPINVKDEKLVNYAFSLYTKLNKIIPTVIDDRIQSPGVKFKDAELLGFPIFIILGPKSFEKGTAEIKIRKRDEKLEIDIVKVIEKVCELLNLPTKDCCVEF
ncbi:proline--tRNA ligase [Caldanaerovirga acetigignens]|uniref:proline--tRNA ligase n=1 Tax=Caldanaerovirga acetigignens TaxID=447595 RepID=UPI0013563ED1|nr:YbaK/EbsC family protein [Caldanaerovirga acetigignens]